MEFLNSMDPQLMIGIGCILCALLGAVLFYPFAAKDRKKTFLLAEKTMKLQQESHKCLQLILQEVKRSNRALCILADVEIEEISAANQSSMEDAASQTKLYVGNIDYAATEAELADHFARFGRVEFVNIPINRYNGRARGFGFVTFTSIQEAERAMALNGSEFKGRQIQVNFAKERD